MAELPNGCFQDREGDQLLLLVFVVGFLLLALHGFLPLDVVGLDGVQFRFQFHGGIRDHY